LHVGRNVPADGIRRVLVAVHLEEAHHALEAGDGGRVVAILELTEGDEQADEYDALLGEEEAARRGGGHGGRRGGVLSGNGWNRGSWELGGGEDEEVPRH